MFIERPGVALGPPFGIAKPSVPADRSGVIQRDYILRMIEEFIQLLGRINSLKREQMLSEACAVTDEEFQRLVGAGPEAAARLSETELLARIIKGESSQTVRQKTLMVVRLFQEAGDLAFLQERAEDGRFYHLKALHLLLDALASDDPFECPDFVPRVEALLAPLLDSPLSPATQARLMRHYETIGEFAKAEDWLFALIEAEPESVARLDFGVLFYERLRGQSDAVLAAGNLPRAEVESGLGELRARRTALG